MTDKNANTEIRKEFCPNCEAETPCTHEAELYVCDICGEDFAKYIVSRNCNVSDVSMTRDVLTDIKTGRSVENTNPDYYKDELYLDEDFRMLAKTYPADVSAIGVTTLIDYVEAVEAELASRINELHYANTVCMEQKHKIARRDELIKRLVEDAKALAIMPYYTNDIRDLGVGGYCRYCHKSQESGHADFCEIVLHRALMQELEKEATDADN